MKFVSFFAFVVILLAGQSCMSVFSDHSRASVKVETNTAVKVYVFSHGNKKFIPANQTENLVEGNRSSTEIRFKKVIGMRPIETKPKKLKKLRKGGELIINKKEYTAEMYNSGMKEVSGFDSTIRTDVKQGLILKLVPEDQKYKEVIYQVNAQKNKKRKNLTLGVDLPFLVLAIPFLAIDLKANQVQYDLPEKINFTMPLKTAEEQANVPVSINYNKNNVPVKETLEPFNAYSIKTDEKLESMKKTAVEGGDFTTAADIKIEQENRKAEQEKINALQKQLDEKVKAEDYAGANEIKKEFQPLKDKAEKKQSLRKELETALAVEDYAKAEKIRLELKALY